VVEIIPSINVQTFAEVQDRVKRVEPYVQWCHLDVTDGIFSTHETWRNSDDLDNLNTTINIEVHLMVTNPEGSIGQWLKPPVKRIIVHIEAVSDMDSIVLKCHEKGIQVGLAANPETPWEKLEPWVSKVDLIQVLAVHPGPSGQEVNWPAMLGKIRHIREACVDCIIEVDGGINPETAKRAVEFGADLLVAGSYVFDEENIAEAINNFKRS